MSDTGTAGHHVMDGGGGTAGLKGTRDGAARDVQRPTPRGGERGPAGGKKWDGFPSHPTLPLERVQPR